MNLVITKETLPSGLCEIQSTGLTFQRKPTESEWSQIGETLKTAQEQADTSLMWWIGDWYNAADKSYGDLKTLAENLGFKYKVVANATSTCKRVSRRRETLSFAHHVEVASLKPEKQTEMLDLAVNESLTVKELRTAVRYSRQADRHDSYKKTDVENMEGPFNVVLADPPWQYEHTISDSRSIENQYPTMELNDICDMNVQSICDDDCVLFLWVTTPMLEQGLKVIESWGFEYRTSIVWVKDRIGMGHWVRQQHEFLFIATKGNMPTPLVENKPSSVINAPREEHSKKPDVFYETIEKMFSDIPKVELFCRQPRDGWAVWGFES